MTQKQKGEFFSVTRPCPACHGSGMEPGSECGKCGGPGTIEGTRTVEVSVPEGVAPGTVLRLKGLGSAGERGGAPGDLLLALDVEDDPEFAREGNDVRSDVKVPLWTAALGGSVSVKTLRGSADVKIPAGTSSDTWLRLRGQGIRGGDHRVRVVVVVPELSARQRDLLREAMGA
jgi:molecular chaperone DnaJ